MCRVGNRNVVSIPREFEASGYAPGSGVLVEELPGGELRILPTEKLREQISRIGRRVVADHEEALRILAEHDPDSTTCSPVAEDDLELVYLTLEDALNLYAAIVGVTITQAAAALRASSSQRVDATNPELADWIIALSGDLTPEQLAERIRERLTPAIP